MNSAPDWIVPLLSLLTAVLVDLTHHRVKTLHVELNSRLTELIAANRRVNLAEGAAAERADQRG